MLRFTRDFSRSRMPKCLCELRLECLRSLMKQRKKVAVIRAKGMPESSCMNSLILKKIGFELTRVHWHEREFCSSVHTGALCKYRNHHRQSCSHLEGEPFKPDSLNGKPRVSPHGSTRVVAVSSARVTPSGQERGAPSATCDHPELLKTNH